MIGRVAYPRYLQQVASPAVCDRFLTPSWGSGHEFVLFCTCRLEHDMTGRQSQGQIASPLACLSLLGLPGRACPLVTLSAQPPPTARPSAVHDNRAGYLSTAATKMCLRISASESGTMTNRPQVTLRLRSLAMRDEVLDCALARVPRRDGESLSCQMIGEAG